MEIPRQHYTEEFKQEAVKLVRESGLSIAEAGRRLNISSMTLKNWVYRSKNPDAGKKQVGLFQTLKQKTAVCARSWQKVALSVKS